LVSQRLLRQEKLTLARLLSVHSALVAFEEEKAFEVYSYEDTAGDICGPFSFNELQEQFARCRHASL
jgi:hypothetical protein